MDHGPPSAPAIALDTPGGTARPRGGALDRPGQLQRLKLLRETPFFDLPLAGMSITTPDCYFVHVNDRYCEIVSYTRDELSRMRWLDFTHPDDVGVNWTLFQGTARGATDRFRMEKRYLRKDGSTVFVEVCSAATRDENGEIEFFVSMIHDISERRRAELALRQSEESLRLVVGSLEDLVFHIGLNLQIVNVWTRDHSRLFLPPAQFLGRTLREVFASWRHVGDPIIQTCERVLATGRSERLDYPDPQSSGAWYQARIAPLATSDGKCSGLVATIRDITEQRRAEEHIYFLAHHDPLTGLANRVHLKNQVEVLMADLRTRGATGALFFLDLDRFKDTNDALGHSVGDALLVAVARRLARHVPPRGILSRQGGDEFVLFAPMAAGDAALQGASLVQALGRPYQVAQSALMTGVSVGVALFPQDGQDFETLLTRADIALYAAKAAGRNAMRFYSEELRHRAVGKVETERQLRRGMARGELHLYYQPQVCLTTGDVIGAEALLRWDSPELGRVEPRLFIPVAEESGLIIELGDWVLKTAISQIMGWEKAGMSPLRVAVNLSAFQVTPHSDLAHQVQKLLEESGCPPERLELELTESALPRSGDLIVDLMKRLNGLGVQLTLDDFGMGYSNLNYLRRMAFDRIKIDRTFLLGLPADESSAALTRAIIQMTRGLGLRCVAEGVESAVQAHWLAESGCHEAQGYYYGEAMPAEEFQRWWERRRQGVSSTPSGGARLDPRPVSG